MAQKFAYFVLPTLPSPFPTPIMPTNLGHRVLPCLLVSDMRRSLDFYLEVLGFTQTGYYPIESEPIRTEVRRDNVALILYTEVIHVGDRTPAFTGACTFSPKAPTAWQTNCAAKCRSPGARKKPSLASANSPFATRMVTRWCSPNGRSAVVGPPSGDERFT